MAGRLALEAPSPAEAAPPERCEFGVWEGTAPPPPPTRPLEGPLDTDVAIVGGGYTGLSTALHLTEAGSPPVLLEAQEPGWGASGRNTGWLEPNWWLKTPADMVKAHGAVSGARLSRWVASGPKRLETWIARYGLELELEQRGLLLATDRPEKAGALEAEARDWQALGVPNEYVDGPAIARHVPTSRYVGGLMLRDGLTLNPLALSRELARACLAGGTRICSRSPVTLIQRERTGWRLDTPRGYVRCRRLVLATDAYTRDLWPRLRNAYATWHLAVIASAPDDNVRSLLPANVAFGDLGLGNIFTLRTARGRLVTSTFAPLRRSLGAERIARPFMRKFRRVFPRHVEPRWQLVHFGEIGLSRDMMPRLAVIGPDAWTAYGYSGTGINLALLLGGELAQLAAHGAAARTLFPVTGIEPVHARGLIGVGLKYLHAPLARHLVSHFG
jgi:L-pipecolate oxidase